VEAMVSFIAQNLAVIGPYLDAYLHYNHANSTDF